MTARRSNSGFALLFVIFISLALLALAIPFAHSMRAQERGAHQTQEQVRSRFAATAARNRAVAGVLDGEESREERGQGNNPFQTPYWDTLDEFPTARVGRAALGPGEGTAFVQDEQGKINTRTAPQAVVDRLRSRVDARVHDLRDYLTETSGRPASWGWPQTIRGTRPARRGNLVIEVDDAGAFGPGTRVRVTGPRGT
ncbi:MAG: hypothetical protein HUU15_14855, partial [Candidatus Brocadiae bacterium]|nr:hypothetical protein [Candidatus Brocadiia bacterium]